MKKWLIILIALLSIGGAAGVRAANLETGVIHVREGEVINGNLYVTGESVVVDGNINGDLIALAQEINIKGMISGDLIAIAQEINVGGEIGGNVRVMGNYLNITGLVARNVNAFGSKIYFGPESRIGWDVYLMGEDADLRGVVDGDLSGKTKQTTISGLIGKNVNLSTDQKGGSTALTITSTGVINGDLRYSSESPANISSDSSVAGEIIKTQPTPQNDNGWLVWAWKKIFSIFSALLVGLVFIFAGKNIFQKLIDGIESAPNKAIIPGLITLLSLPPLAMVVAFSLIGIPLSLIIVSTWLILIYLGKILSAVIVGRLVINKLIKPTKTSLPASLVVGVLLVWSLAALPYLGWLVGLSASVIGMGGFWNYVHHERENI